MRFTSCWETSALWLQWAICNCERSWLDQPVAFAWRPVAKGFKSRLVGMGAHHKQSLCLSHTLGVKSRHPASGLVSWVTCDHVAPTQPPCFLKTECFPVAVFFLLRFMPMNCCVCLASGLRSQEIHLSDWRRRVERRCGQLSSSSSLQLPQSVHVEAFFFFVFFSGLVKGSGQYWLSRLASLKAHKWN